MADNEELIRLRHALEVLRHARRAPDARNEFDARPPATRSHPSHHAAPRWRLRMRLAVLVALFHVVLRSDRRVALLLFALVAVPYFSTAVGVMNSMDGPQYALTRAIVEKHTFSLNGYDWIYPDWALVDGKQYSQRSPGISLLAVPLYLYSHALTGHLSPPHLVQNTRGITAESPLEAMTYGLVSLLGAGAVALFYLIMRQHGARPIVGVVAALIFAFGTLFWTYAASFVREPAEILFLFGAYLSYLKLGAQPRRSLALILGTLTGWAPVCDNLAVVPGTLVLGAAIILLVRTERLALVPWAVGGLLVGVLPLMIYNIRVFHHPFVIQYMYAQWDLNRVSKMHFLADLRWSIPVNLFTWGYIAPQALPYVATDPQFAVAMSATWALQTNYKGIFIQSPILFVAVGYALLQMRRSRTFLLPLTAAAVFFVLVARTSYFFHPNNFDTRYFLPATAFFFVPLGTALEGIQARRRPLRIALWLGVAVLALLSILNGWEAVLLNYTPHQTGDERDSLYLIARHAIPFAAKVAEAFFETFPNYANVRYLLPIVAPIVLYALMPLARFWRQDASVAMLPAATTKPAPPTRLESESEGHADGLQARRARRAAVL